MARFLGYNVTGGPGAARAIHPSEVIVEGPGTGRAGVVLASGSVGRGWIAYIDLADGERWESRGTDDRPRPAASDAVGLRWSREVPLLD